MQKKIHFSKDISLIIECCKTNQDESAIKQLITDIKNWDEFINLCHAHGVYPLVYHVLKLHVDTIPNDILKTMKLYNMNIVKENMLMTAELIKVMKLLEENDIEAIAFKGPTLSQMAYGDITLRQYCALDILVDKNNIYKINTLLKDDYSRSLKLTSSQEHTWFKYSHDLGLTNKKSYTHIEFHWSMLDTDHPVNLQEINFFKNKSSVTINNYDIPTISKEAFLLYLCIHGSKHMFERIEWIVDIDKFVQTNDIDWFKFQELVDDKNYKNFVYLGLYLSTELFNTTIPKEVKYNNTDVKVVSNYIINTWNTHTEAKNSTNIKYTMKLFTSKVDIIKFIHKMYFKPTFTEYWHTNLPSYLYILYYPLRQYLLIKKYLFKSSN